MPVSARHKMFSAAVYSFPARQTAPARAAWLRASCSHRRKRHIVRYNCVLWREFVAPCAEWCYNFQKIYPKEQKR